MYSSAPQTTQPIRVMLVDDQRLVRGGLSMLVNSQPDLQVVMEADDGLAAIDVFDRMVSEGQAPQVILMDVRMPHCDGLEAARRILERDGEREVSEDERVRIIMLTTFDIDEYVYSAVRAGASGFLLKDTPPEQLLEAIRTVHRGDAVIAPSATRRLLEHMIPVLDSPAPVVPTAPAAPAAESVPVTPPAAGSELPKATFIPAEHASFEPVQDYPHRELIEQLSPREFEVLGLIARGLSNAEITRELVLSEATVKTHVSHVLAKLGARDRVQAVIMAYEAGIAH
ncbi:NagC family transcriptional regulator [Rothia sp. HMSC066H02]|uniref:response regulator n=1 Tax=unclassified Rothia (in: high G+C Gram-positive bacteria) TaxID=2689056 RepID=UPI0008A32FB6|nr:MULTISPECIES: response regulator transcription factor [unclassified Rothia (in: high G+C Gram-positive bacteria)]OFO96825.1 NagC family transcriptional regulator [Rothia sp. HMSC065D09]OFP13649.1 NagC family transcriptional regulator [Rothia sp. HMSC066H02]